MKKISLIALLFGAHLALFAQTSKPTKMAVKTRFGVKAGVNIAELRAKNFPSSTQVDVNTKSTFHGGFFVNIPFGTGNLSFQPELLYNGQGSKVSETSTKTVGTVTTTTKSTYDQALNYISIPMMLHVKSSNGFIVELGPQISYLVKAQQDGAGTTTDYKGNFDKMEYSIGGGLSYLSRIGLGIGARYNWGLRNIYNDATTVARNDAKLKNSVINIGLSWSFGAGK